MRGGNRFKRGEVGNQRILLVPGQLVGGAVGALREGVIEHHARRAVVVLERGAERRGAGQPVELRALELPDAIGAGQRRGLADGLERGRGHVPGALDEGRDGRADERLRRVRIGRGAVDGAEGAPAAVLAAGGHAAAHGEGGDADVGGGGSRGERQQRGQRHHHHRALFGQRRSSPAAIIDIVPISRPRSTNYGFIMYTQVRSTCMQGETPFLMIDV